VPKYLLAYHGGGMPETEAEGQRVMAAWGTWYQELGAAVVEPGNPIGKTKVVEPGGAASDHADSPVSGYTILQADSMDMAIQMTKGCPILESGGSVEVGETFEMG
jgi:hypothetical protein